jgi:predicted PurR-regulated permease PerM
MQRGTKDSVAGGGNWPRRLVFWASVATAIFLCLWYWLDIILLVFGGVLLAIILHACADWLDRHTPRIISHNLSYAAIVLGIVLLAVLISYWIVPSAISEIGQVARIIPKSLAQVTAYLNQRGWGKFLVRAVHNFMIRTSQGEQLGTLTLGIERAIEGTVVILVVGFYGALNARSYARGLLELAPGRYRARVREVSEAVIYTLRWWVIGQLVPMFVLGISTTIGLLLLGVPMALVLGLLTGLMIFIPYIGAWIAFVPTALVSLTKGPDTMIYVVILYLAIHAAEGYILTPLVQKRAVLLPPVLTILAQLFMWEVNGPLGLALATPIAAALLVLVKTLYLHEEIETEC